MPLAERIETRKHALATCAWLAARMGMPQVYDLLQPGWDIRNNFHRRREDLAAEVDYARHLVLDLKVGCVTPPPHSGSRCLSEASAEAHRRVLACAPQGMLEGMLSEEAALSRQLRHAEAEHRAGLAATDRQLEVRLLAVPSLCAALCQCPPLTHACASCRRSVASCRSA